MSPGAVLFVYSAIGFWVLLEIVRSIRDVRVAEGSRTTVALIFCLFAVFWPIALYFALKLYMLRRPHDARVEAARAEAEAAEKEVQKALEHYVRTKDEKDGLSFDESLERYKRALDAFERAIAERESFLDTYEG